MYLISIVIFFLIICFIITGLGGLGSLSIFYFIDLSGLAGIFLLSLPMLEASGLASDFFHAFRIALNKKLTADAQEIRRAHEAVGLVMKLLLFSGLLFLILTVISILRTLTDITTLGHKTVLALYPCAYAVILNILLLPLKARLKLMAEYNA